RPVLVAAPVEPALGAHARVTERTHSAVGPARSGRARAVPLRGRYGRRRPVRHRPAEAGAAEAADRSRPRRMGRPRGGRPRARALGAVSRPVPDTTPSRAMRVGLGLEPSELDVDDVVADGWLGRLMDAGDARLEEVPQPASLHGELRPYQRRGLGWLAFLDTL